MGCSYKQSGLSLIEIMIAMLISLILLGGVIQVYSSTRLSYQTNEGLSRLQENARFVLDRIAVDLGAGGYMGCNDSENTDASGSPLLINKLGDQTSADYINPLSGTEGTGINGSDSISIRRAIGGSSISLATPFTKGDTVLMLDPASPNLASLQPFQTLAIADCEKTTVFMITAVDTTTGVVNFAPNVVAPAGGINPGQFNIGTAYNSTTITDLKGNFDAPGASAARTLRVATSIYSICNDANSNSGFALCLNGTPYVNDIVNLNVLYGLDADATTGTEQYVAANDAALTAAGMNSVSSVRIDLTLNADGINVNGQPVQKTFSQTYRIRNR